MELIWLKENNEVDAIALVAAFDRLEGKGMSASEVASIIEADQTTVLGRVIYDALTLSLMRDKAVSELKAADGQPEPPAEPAKKKPRWLKGCEVCNADLVTEMKTLVDEEKMSVNAAAKRVFKEQEEWLNAAVYSVNALRQRYIRNQPDKVVRNGQPSKGKQKRSKSKGKGVDKGKGAKDPFTAPGELVAVDNDNAWKVVLKGLKSYADFIVEKITKGPQEQVRTELDNELQGLRQLLTGWDDEVPKV